MQSESLDHLLAALRQRSPLPPIPALPALHRGEVIEIQGPGSSGKTHVLYHILASLVVSPAPQIAVVVYDTDASFDIRRFRRLLLSRTTLDPHQCLQRVHVFRPTSIAQLAASIAHLPAYHSSHMPNQEIAALAIDSISSFYWADRFSTEQSRQASPDNGLHHVFSAIQSVWRSHRPLTVLTNWALNAAPSHPRSSYKQHLHPFPLLDGSIPGSATEILGSGSSPFRLAHYISLSSPSHTLLSDSRGIADDRAVRGWTRSSGTRDPAYFAFQITDDDLLVRSEPEQSAESIL